MVLQGRFPPEMGARILSALDAAMAAHAAEQPAAGWDDEGLPGAEGRPSWDVSTRHIPRLCERFLRWTVLGNEPLPTAEKTPRCS